MSDVTGGQLLARCLANEGVRFVFGLPCPEIDPLLAALEEYDMRLVPIRHEAAAVYMAAGVYKTTGQVAAVLGNPGPGSANLLPGVITAMHDGVPVVVITAQHRLGIVYPSSPATFQGQDQLDLFRPTVKWGGPVLSWDRLPEVTRMAFREMWTGRPGPVHLEIPLTTMYATGNADAMHIPTPDRYRACTPRPAEEDLRAAAEMLAAAERPLVVAGTGVDRADAHAVLTRVVERLGCPVITTMAGRAAVPSDHPAWVSGSGAGSDVGRREADVVLVVGSRLGNLDLPYDKYWGDPLRQRVIQIDLDPRNIGVTRPIALGIIADAKLALEGLVRVLGDAPPSHGATELLARAREAAATWDQRQSEGVLQWAGPGIHPAHALLEIGSAFGRDAVYVVDGGNTSLWAHGVLPPSGPRSYHSILELGMLGVGVPTAIGAKLAAPDREVVCVTGDGAAGFHFMEMQSAAREGLDMVTIVFAEGSWTMEEPNERLLYGRTFGTDMGTIRWDRTAEGLGCHGEYVEQLDELSPALARARAAKGPAVVCIRSDRDANLAMPPEMLSRFVEVYQGPGE